MNICQKSAAHIIKDFYYDPEQCVSLLESNLKRRLEKAPCTEGQYFFSSSPHPYSFFETQAGSPQLVYLLPHILKRFMTSIVLRGFFSFFF